MAELETVVQLGVGGSLAYALLRLFLRELLAYLRETAARAQAAESERAAERAELQRTAIDSYRKLEGVLTRIEDRISKLEERRRHRCSRPPPS